jgi:hypothetical protein
VATTTLDDTRLRTATSRAVATTLREVVEHSLVDARAATRQVAAALAAGIRAMQEVGELLASLDDDQAVVALLAGIQGGVTIMLSTGQCCRSRARLRWLGSSDRPASGWPTTRCGLAQCSSPRRRPGRRPWRRPAQSGPALPHPSPRARSSGSSGHAQMLAKSVLAGLLWLWHSRSVASDERACAAPACATRPQLASHRVPNPLD